MGNRRVYVRRSGPESPVSRAYGGCTPDGTGCGGQRTAVAVRVKAEPSSRGVPWQLKVLPVKQR
ncbi:hypothetical protein GCM10009737_36460 [Nocardioides lentus]|uniref:Uncharacterized protein n=1 Tax=Nocardioides lentus TaxID=338077 RepID=A0ABP5B4U9_9ACTN